MENNVDILAIYCWDEGDIRHYRSKGIGKKYDELYRWIYTTSYKCTSEDMPWDYFIFQDPADHDRLIEKFGDDVIYESYDELD
jgi:hypothetical protein